MVIKLCGQNRQAGVYLNQPRRGRRWAALMLFSRFFVFFKCRAPVFLCFVISEGVSAHVNA